MANSRRATVIAVLAIVVVLAALYYLTFLGNQVDMPFQPVGH